MRQLTFAITFAFIISACFDTDEPKKVEVVDSRSVDNTDVGTKTITEDDFAAMQAEIKSLKKALASLEARAAEKSDVNALQADALSHESDLTILYANAENHEIRLTAAETAVSSKSPSDEWLYDGNGEKRYRVKTRGLNSALVELSDGIFTNYFGINMRAPASSYPNIGKPQQAQSTQLMYEASDCSGQPHLAHHLYNVVVAMDDQYAALITGGAFVGTFTYSSYRSTPSSGCQSYAQPVTSHEAWSANLLPLANYTYPSPLTVGP